MCWKVGEIKFLQLFVGKERPRVMDEVSAPQVLAHAHPSLSVELCELSLCINDAQ